MEKKDIVKQADLFKDMSEIFYELADLYNKEEEVTHEDNERLTYLMGKAMMITIELQKFNDLK